MCGAGGGGAGIGGGFCVGGGKVTINGGIVTATGGKYGAGIGGGWHGDGGTVTISGGEVTAIGKDGGKGIGGGNGNGGGLVSINGGTVRAEGWDALGETVTLGENVAAYDVTGGEPGTLITEETLLTSVDKILAVYDAPVGPTCEGGEIELVNGVWVVTPNGAVTMGGETIPVKPTIGDLDEGEPFAVGKGAVMVAVRAIPGLKYELRRAGSLSAPRGEGAPPVAGPPGAFGGGYAGTVWSVVGEPVVAEALSAACR